MRPYAKITAKAICVLGLSWSISASAEYLCNILTDEHPDFTSDFAETKTLTDLARDKSGRQVGIIHATPKYEFRLVEGKKTFINEKLHRAEFYTEILLRDTKQVIRANSGVSGGNEHARIELSNETEDGVRPLTGIIFTCTRYDFSSGEA